MRSGSTLASLAVVSFAILGPLGPFNPLWLPYGAFVTKSAGNPNWDAYIGQPGSTYDSAANPAQTIGTVSYNPNAPLPPVAPSSPSGSASGAQAPRP